MGKINAENLLQFRSSAELFNRIKKKLSSFDSQNMIDEGDFYGYVVYVLEALGVAVYRECEAVIHVEHHKAKMPCNFKYWYAGYKVHREFGNVPSINEQRPFIFYQDNEISQICPASSGNCKIGCDDPNGKSITKVVVRTYVNGDEFMDHYAHGQELFLSPNVREKCDPNARKVNRTHLNEVTIDDEGYLHTVFEKDSVYLQYYGLPFDKDFLPMIPDQSSIEKAIEFYIYTQLFEEWYLNSSVPNIAQQLKYVKDEYNHMHWPQALYYVKLPGFQRTIQSIKLMRSKGKWAEWNFDRTRVGENNTRGYAGFPIV